MASNVAYKIKGIKQKMKDKLLQPIKRKLILLGTIFLCLAVGLFTLAFLSYFGVILKDMSDTVVAVLLCLGGIAGGASVYFYSTIKEMKQRIDKQIESMDINIILKMGELNK